MIPQTTTSGTIQVRLFGWGEWLLVLGIAATFAWTTLCLGGYLAQTMVVSSAAVFGLTALGGGLWMLGRGGPPLTFNGAALLPVPFLLYALASVLWLAPARWLAWGEWLLWLQMWLVFVLVLHFGRGRGQTWVLIGTFLGLGLTGVFMAAYQRYVDKTWIMLGRTQAEQFYGRSGGMFGIPNSLAGLLELMIPTCLALMTSRATRVGLKIVCGWLLALFVFAVILTGSRGGWISIALALMLWPLLGGREWRRRLAGAALILALAVGGLWALYRFSGHAYERIQPFIEGKFELSRPFMWRAALKIWQDHPVAGSGAASYNVIYDRYREKAHQFEPQWAHNDYLNTLSDYGLAGFGLWVLAGGGLLWLGWKAVRRTRHEGVTTTGLFGLWRWKLGLFLGLLAYAFHLGVDFHTKLPALAFAAAIVTALLLRDEPGLIRAAPPAWARGLGLASMLAALVLAGRLAVPLYRAEALRDSARHAINKQAKTGVGDLRVIIPAALAGLEESVKIDPSNGQAWADYSYATVLSWHASKGDLKVIGVRGAQLADRALALCPLSAEFWVRKGVALDMQARRSEGETCFRRALDLAPNTGHWWYYYAYHLSVAAKRKQEALLAVETCLALDPSNSAGVALRQQLLTVR